MPYVFVEELAEGQVEANVVTQETYDQLSVEFSQLQSDLEAARADSDANLTRAEEAANRAIEFERKYNQQRQKYADAFLAKPVEGQVGEVKPPITHTQTYDALFGGSNA